MAKGITIPQRNALLAMPFDVPMWGGKLLGKLPHGVRSMDTLRALDAKGLASSSVNGIMVTWQPTGAGRAILKPAPPKSRGGRPRKHLPMDRRTRLLAIRGFDVPPSKQADFDTLRRSGFSLDECRKMLRLE